MELTERSFSYSSVPHRAQKDFVFKKELVIWTTVKDEKGVSYLLRLRNVYFGACLVF